jgi:hypothetical protein
MEPATTGHDAIGHDESPVQHWRGWQLSVWASPAASDHPTGAPRLTRAAHAPHCRLTPTARTSAMTGPANWRDEAACRAAPS